MNITQKFANALGAFRPLEQPRDPNRAERRAYYHGMSRRARLHVAGFGRWQRHRYLTRQTGA